MERRRLTLVSASPRRRDLLLQLGIPFDIIPTIAPEVWSVDSVRSIAELNARRKVERSSVYDDRFRVLIGADTIVELDGDFLGKPSGPHAAMRMIERLSGRSHSVITGLCLSGFVCSGRLTRTTAAVSISTEVKFKQLSRSEIRAYIRNREWQGKAGAYAIQGDASRFVSQVIGSFDNVVGLPTDTLREMLSNYFGQVEFC